ncbi:MAG TPA: DUF5107 domain-containing protein, partial [Pirellulales bacterium]
MGKLTLPDAPADLSGPVKAWRQAVVMPTYLPHAPDCNPMFLERRVYQGSSGKVYPLPFTDRVNETPVDQEWDAIHIENEFIRLMILPQIGGRIHVGLDKTNGYDFFYRQNVIKPALVGLAGPWISGGVEFNWPQHHRPSTFMPVAVEIERYADGSVTVWCSEHEPMNRIKGMHGVRLHPGKSIVELNVRLFNRTEFIQTFLWWANVAARVHEQYQSFFPPDVAYIADHAKRATSRFPFCDGKYYGVDYATRAIDGVPDEELPSQFVPLRGQYPPNDLSWYANIPVPTSYMAMGSRADFFGGYDHSQQAGLIHVANRHIAPGKKQWTWGNHEFGYAWDRNLSDDDGPYIELMAGVYTDNQPDFSFLHPGETRVFSQAWYPIQQIGPAQQANLEAAVSLAIHDGSARIGVAATSRIDGAAITLSRHGQSIKEIHCDLAPNKPLVETVSIPVGCELTELRLCMTDSAGRVLIEYSPQPAASVEVPPAATEPPLPAEIESNEELYLTGLHLEQYRHATRVPEDYWREALRRDPTDSRSNNAMGLWHLRRGELELAASHFQTGIDTLMRRNPNPRDGEPFYNLGLTLRYLNRDEAAYDAFYKATWSYAWQSSAFYALAQLDCGRKQWPAALAHLDCTLRVNTDHLQARNLKAIVLRKLNRQTEAEESLRTTLAIDPLDEWAKYLRDPTDDHAMKVDPQIQLDIALDFVAAGLFAEAIEVLQGADASDVQNNPACGASGTAPLVQYYLACFHNCCGSSQAAIDARQQAQSASLKYCFPARLAEIEILQSAIQADANDATARYLLGNLFYDRRRYAEAIALWESAAKLQKTFPTVWRNLGIAYFNVLNDSTRARVAYDKALAADESDARVLYERDQLWKRTGEDPRLRLTELERRRILVDQRDDLSIELASLYNQTSQPERALEILRSRHFQPWEGGEGLALGQHVRTHLALGCRELAISDPANARKFFETALAAPDNLGEAKHLLANQSDVHYFIGLACQLAGDHVAAQSHWHTATDFRGDFQEMSVRAFSELSLYSALAMKVLGQHDRADQLLIELTAYADDLEQCEAKIDYFATSLPTMLLFHDNLQSRQTDHAKLLRAQSLLGRGQ